MMDPLMQQSETAGPGSTPVLAMAKLFQSCWLQVHCQAATRLKLLLCMQLTQRHHTCSTSSSSQTASLLSKVYSHPESSWKEIHSAFSATDHNTARWLSSGSLLTVGPQQTRSQIVLPSLVENKSSTTWKSLMDKPEL